MRAICVLFDSSCEFCRHCARWLCSQEQAVKVWCLPRGTRQAIEAFGEAVNQGGAAELIVIDSDGGVYRGPDAFIMCFWALERYRGWATRFATPTLKPYARAMFELVSSKRHLLANVLSRVPDEEIASRLRAAAPAQSAGCEGDACRAP